MRKIGVLQLAEKYMEDQEIRECQIESWMAIQMQDPTHLVYFGKAAMGRIILNLYQLTPSHGTLPDYLRVSYWHVVYKHGGK